MDPNFGCGSNFMLRIQISVMDPIFGYGLFFCCYCKMSEPTGQPNGANTIVGKSRMESIGSDVDINLGTYVSRITAYVSPITLSLGTNPDHGKIKKIYNETGGNVVINSDINVQGGATDTITLSSGGWILLLYLLDPDITERFREIDGESYTIS